MDINIVFCRRLLAHAYEELTPQQKAHYRKHGWTWTDGNGHWEFHMTLSPLHKESGELYWYGDADNAYHARYHGLSHYLAKHGTAEQKEKFK